MESCRGQQGEYDERHSGFWGTAAGPHEQPARALSLAAHSPDGRCARGRLERTARMGVVRGEGWSVQPGWALRAGKVGAYSPDGRCARGTKMDFVHKFQPGTKPLALLLLHGSGGDENDLIPVASALAPGAALLSPRGQVLQHGARRFFGYPGPDGFDQNEIADRAGELAEWLGRMKKQYELGLIYAFGYSNGANIAAALMLLYPGAVAGACLLRARAMR